MEDGRQVYRKTSFGLRIGQEFVGNSLSSAWVVLHSSMYVVGRFRTMMPQLVLA